jgi:hypothetical protein
VHRSAEAALAVSLKGVSGAVLMVALAGCAQLTVDPDGTRHLVGFMALTLPPPAAASGVGADVVRMRTVGLAVTRGAVTGGSLVLGYSDTTLGVVRNHSVVTQAELLDPMNVPRRAAPAASQPEVSR